MDDAPPHIAASLATLAIPIESVNLDGANARIHDAKNLAAIKASLSRFGQRLPIVIQREGMVVRAGNGRVVAARELGWDEIAAVIVDEGDVEATAFAIADNRTAELGGWDDEILASTLKGLEDSGDGIAELGFSDTDLLSLFDDPEEIIEDEIPEAPDEPVAKRGQIWKLGRHRVMCGDCTDTGAVDGLLSEGPVDALVTDPPYSSGGQFRSDRSQSTTSKYVNSGQATQHSEFSGDNRDQRAFLSWASGWLRDAYARTRPGGVAAVFTDWRQLPTMTDAIQGGGWVWRNLVTWWKPGCRMQRGRFSLSAEYVLYASIGVPTPGESSPQNVLQYASERGDDKNHIAEKPVALMAEIIGVTPRGASIYDPFLGSGTTLIAAEKLGRTCYGTEIEPAYVDVIVARWEALTGLQAELIEAPSGVDTALLD